MQSQLSAHYTLQGMTHALNILRSPGDYRSRPHIRVKALEYVYSHRKRHEQYTHQNADRIIPLLYLSMSATKMYEEMEAIGHVDLAREIADILYRHGATRVLAGLGRRTTTTIAPEQKQPNNNHPLPAQVKTEHVDIKTPRTVYQDTQNVHNSKINQSVLTAASVLIQEHKLVIMHSDPTKNKDFQNELMENIRSFLVQKHEGKQELINKSLEYIRGNIAVFSSNGTGTTACIFTLTDVLLALWVWMINHKNFTELQDRLLDEFRDMDGYCTSGHLARLINVVQGYTDEERLNIRIDNKDRCRAIVTQHLTQCLATCKDEKVIDDMSEKNTSYVEFMRKSVADKMPEWNKEFGVAQDKTGFMVKFLTTVINQFAGAKIFEP